MCQGCSLEGTYLCVSCQGKIAAVEPRCLACNKKSLLGLTHQECASQSALKGLLVAADYENDAIRDLIWNLKYNSVSAICATLATVMADFFISSDITEYFAGAVVTAVPLHRRRARERGFNQAELIAAEFSKKLGMDFINLLEKQTNTERQAVLPRDKRLANLASAFQIAAGIDPAFLENKKVIIVDDVAATGATLSECAKALKTLNPQEIWGLVVARN